MKDMNFLIFRDFSRIFVNLFWILKLNNKKIIILISRADVVGAMTCSHAATYVHTTW